MPDEPEVHGLLAIMLLHDSRREARFREGDLMLLADQDPHDWPQIAALYGELYRLTGSPVVALNRAAAVAESEGPEAGLAIADGLDLDEYHYLHSTRGELLRRLGRTDEAREAYRRALALVHDEAERRLLERRLDLFRAP
jgi:RNA polymerase sigma-70 factor, ECF subfamily